MVLEEYTEWTQTNFPEKNHSDGKRIAFIMSGDRRKPEFQFQITQSIIFPGNNS